MISFTIKVTRNISKKIKCQVVGIDEKGFFYLMEGTFDKLRYGAIAFYDQDLGPILRNKKL